MANQCAFVSERQTMEEKIQRTIQAEMSRVGSPQCGTLSLPLPPSLLIPSFLRAIVTSSSRIRHCRARRAYRSRRWPWRSPGTRALGQIQEEDVPKRLRGSRLVALVATPVRRARTRRERKVRTRSGRCPAGLRTRELSCVFHGFPLLEARPRVQLRVLGGVRRWTSLPRVRARNWRSNEDPASI